MLWMNLNTAFSVKSCHRRQRYSVLRILTSVVVAYAMTFPAHADDACDLNRVRVSVKQLAPASDPSAGWVNADVLGMELGKSRSVGVDESVVTINFSKHVESSAMDAPRDFTFRSGWLLNTQFSFRRNDRFQIKARYDIPPELTLYALAPPGEAHLTIFARPDGTLCNKVMNTNAGDHGFLVKQYQSEPKTKLRLITGEAQGEPLMLRIQYLGTSGGVASLRELWSRGGRIVESKDHTFDVSAQRIRIGPLTLENVSITKGAINATIEPPPKKIPVSRYWESKFNR